MIEQMRQSHLNGKQTWLRPKGVVDQVGVRKQNMFQRFLPHVLQDRIAFLDTIAENGLGII